MKSMKRFLYLIVPVYFFGLMSSLAIAVEPSTRPNILLILADDNSQ